MYEVLTSCKKVLNLFGGRYVKYIKFKSVFLNYLKIEAGGGKDFPWLLRDVKVLKGTHRNIAKLEHFFFYLKKG